MVEELIRDWSLTVDGRLMSGDCALVVPVRTRAQEPAALKITWPHWEAEYEHLALRVWDGDGAVRLLRADPRRWALLLERADPTRDLTAIGILESCEVVAGLYRRLHRPAVPQLRRLSELSGDWSERLTRLRGHPLMPRRFADQAAALLRDMAADPATDGTLIHTDLHHLNVLAASPSHPDRGPWLAIDPKPLNGDPAFEIAPLLWNRWAEVLAADSVREAIRERFFAVVDAAGLDEDRARAWVIAREMSNVLWTVEDVERGVPPDLDWITVATTIVKAVHD